MCSLRTCILIALLLFPSTGAFSDSVYEQCERGLALLSAENRVGLEPGASKHGARWSSLFDSLGFDKDAVIVEVAPGDIPKVGLGLYGKGFRGTYYVVEPEAHLLNKVVARYRELLPEANIVPVQSSLEGALPLISKKVDFVVSNHPLDDMVVHHFYSGKRKPFEEFSYQQEVSIPKNWWAEIEQDSAGLAKARESAATDWVNFIDALKPEMTIISQHESGYYKQQGIFGPDHHAEKVLSMIRTQLGDFTEILDPALTGELHQGHRWFISSNPYRKFMWQATAEPAVLERLGSDVFVTTPVGKVPADQVEVLYIDPEVARRLGVEGLLKTPQLLEKLLVDQFALDTELPTDQGDQRKVFVDRQTDPTKIAMNGNQGSGRAAYVGRNLNVIGIGRTPLATAPKDDPHGNGHLELTYSVWRLVAGNSIDRDTLMGASPKLALLRYKNPSTHADGDQFYRSVLVRVDSGALDRPTHLHTGLVEGAPDLRAVAQRFGRLEGEKFMQRLVHGAASAGNVSLNGNMLDMETVSAVVGRHPQYTLTGKYVGNLFATEHHAQFNVIKEMVKNPKANPNGLSEAEAQEIFEQSRQSTLQSRFLDLMGFEGDKGIVLREHGAEIEKLTELFQSLSTKMYPNYPMTYTDRDLDESAHVFDFSNFMRFYALARESRASKSSRIRSGMQFLSGVEADFKPVKSKWLSEGVLEYLQREHVVSNPQQLEQWRGQALDFVRAYEQLMTSLEKEHPAEAAKMGSRAYARNEARWYLTDSYGAEVVGEVVDQYLEKQLTAQQMRRIVGDIIQSNQRMVPGDSLVTDSRVFKEGTLSRRVDASKGTHRIEVNPSSLMDLKEGSSLEISVGTKRYPLRREGDLWVSDAISNAELLKGSQKVRLFSGSKPVELTDFMGEEPYTFFSLKVPESKP